MPMTNLLGHPNPNQPVLISTLRNSVSPTFSILSANSNNSISSSYIDRATPTTKAVLVAAQQERRRLRRANLAILAATLEDQLQQSEEQDQLQRHSD